MFCRFCGSNIADDAEFCRFCGKKLSVEAGSAPVQPEQQTPPPVQPAPQQAPQPAPEQPVPQPAPQPAPVQPAPQQAPQPAPEQPAPQPAPMQYAPQQAPPPVQNVQLQQPVQNAPKPRRFSPVLLVLIIVTAVVTLALMIAVPVGLLSNKNLFDRESKQKVEEEDTSDDDGWVEDDAWVEDVEPAETEEPEDAAEPEETVEAPAAVPYAEEQGFTFEDPYAGDFYFPTYAQVYYLDGNGNRTGEVDPSTVELISSDCQYQFRPFTVSEPDGDGNVLLTIACDAEYHTTLIDKGIGSDHDVGTYWRVFRLFDYYTGQQIDLPAYSELTYDTEPVYTEIEWMDKPVRIGLTSYEEWKYGEYEDKEKTAEGYQVKESTTKGTVFYQVTMPKDYDGLMLVGYKDGVNEELFNAPSQDYVEKTMILGPDNYGLTYTKDDLVLIRVSDAAKESVPDDFLGAHKILTYYPGLQTITTLMKVKNEKDTNELLYMPTDCEVSETIEGCEPGTKKVIGHFAIDYSKEEKNVAFEAWVDAFDRYTGTSFMSGSPLTINAKTKATELEQPITIDTPSGSKEIFMEVESKMDKKNKVMNRTITITCPTDYDGTVFMVGYSSRALAEQLDFEALASRKIPVDELPFLKSGMPYYFYTLNGR